jgi:hypothetical protein
MCLPTEQTTTAAELLRENIYHCWKSDVMGSGYKFSLYSSTDIKLCSHTYLDIFSISDCIDEETNPDSLTESERQYYFAEWKENLFAESFERFFELCKPKFLHLFENQ